jgi:predicted lipid carrier protein YhbT
MSVACKEQLHRAPRPGKEVTMRDQTAKFFAELQNAGHQPLLAKSSGSLRFELADGNAVERWRVDVNHGDIAVSHKAGAADCILRAPELLFLKIASGRDNAMAAVLRGALVVEGDLDLLMAFARTLPGPPPKRATKRSSATATSGKASRSGR